MTGKQVVLAEVYSPGWRAYLNGTEEVSIQETPIAQRAVDIKHGTRFIVFKYNPKSYEAGKIITISTIAALIFLLFPRTMHKT